MEDPRSEPSALQKAAQKIEDHRTLEQEREQIAGSGGVLWTPEADAGKCPLTPASDHIIVRKEEAVGKVGMIHLPGQAAEKTRPNRGTVLKVGEQVKLYLTADMERQSDGGIVSFGRGLQEGDTVIYHEYGEVKFTYGNVDYIAIREKDVIARVEKEDGEEEEAGLPEGQTEGESSRES